jgi:hypothetical protein
MRERAEQLGGTLQAGPAPVRGWRYAPASPSSTSPLRAGAAGFLLKDASPETLTAAIRAVANGQGLIAPEVTRRLIARFAAATPDPARRHELDKLSQREREVLLEVAYGRSNGQIARRLFIEEAVVGKSPDTCRQIAVRARRQIQARKPRFEASRRKRQELAQRFFEAVEADDTQGLVRLLAADVVVYGDGGGKAPASLRPVYGRERVVQLFGEFTPFFVQRLRVRSIRSAEVNGQPGALSSWPGRRRRRGSCHTATTSACANRCSGET